MPRGSPVSGEIGVFQSAALFVVSFSRQSLLGISWFCVAATGEVWLDPAQFKDDGRVIGRVLRAAWSFINVESEMRTAEFTSSAELSPR